MKYVFKTQHSNKRYYVYFKEPSADPWKTPANLFRLQSSLRLLGRLSCPPQTPIYLPRLPKCCCLSPNRTCRSLLRHNRRHHQRPRFRLPPTRTDRIMPHRWPAVISCRLRYSPIPSNIPSRIQRRPRRRALIPTMNRTTLLLNCKTRFVITTIPNHKNQWHNLTHWKLSHTTPM